MSHSFIGSKKETEKTCDTLWGRGEIFEGKEWGGCLFLDRKNLTIHPPKK
jgi:hypothetical protein